MSNTLITQNYLGTGGMPTHGGGGAMLNSAAATLVDCQITENKVNQSGVGGGVYMRGGTLSRCLIEKNVSRRATVNSSYGQGVAMLTGTVADCVIRFNMPPDGDSSDRGGGVFMESGSLLRCQVISNSTAYWGGGVYMGLVAAASAPPAEIRDCVIASNRCTVANGSGAYGESMGGGVYMGSTNDIIRNTLVANNGATSVKMGGGIYITNGLIESVTVVRNQAKDAGGGIFRAPGGQQAVTNAIVWYNDSNDTADDEIANPDNAVFGYSCSPALSQGVNGNSTGNPRFASSGSGFGYLSPFGNYTVAGSSPCVDAGLILGWMTGATDLAGAARIIGGVPDMGCFEFPTSRGTVFSLR